MSENQIETYTEKFVNSVMSKSSTNISNTRTGTKKQICKAIWEHYKDQNVTRKQFMEMFINEGGCTLNGASTYHYNFSKGIW